MFEREFLLKSGGFPPIDLGDEFYLMEKVIRNHGTVSYLPRCDVKALVHTESAEKEKLKVKIGYLHIKRNIGQI